jgi:hypothetical protein
MEFLEKKAGIPKFLWLLIPSQLFGLRLQQAQAHLSKALFRCGCYG